MTNEILKQLLGILRNIIKSNAYYIFLKDYIVTRKTLNGSSFIFKTEEGLPVLKLVLEGINTKIEETSEIEINLFNTLEQLTVDFSLLSGLTNVQWLELAEYCHDSYIRSKQPDSLATKHSDTTDGKASVKLLMRYPWITVLLLTENIEYIVVTDLS